MCGCQTAPKMQIAPLSSLPTPASPRSTRREPAGDSFRASAEPLRLLPRPQAAPDAVARMQASLEVGFSNRYFASGASEGPTSLPEGPFTMVLDKPGAEDALLAAGAALADGLPSLYAVPDRKSLPWFLREADQSFPGRVRIEAHPDPKVLARQASHPGAEVRPLDLPERAPIGTFLGCLMSGLSEEQYASGRQHLQAMDAALTAGGSESNYCEGIMVASTASFGTPKESLRSDLAAVEASRRCVFYVFDGQPRPSGMWVEAGYALAKGKPSLFLVPDRAALPPSLRTGDLPEGVRVVEYGTHENLLESLPALLA